MEISPAIHPHALSQLCHPREKRKIWPAVNDSYTQGGTIKYCTHVRISALLGENTPPPAASQPAYHQQTKLAWGTKNTLVTQKRRGKNKLRSKIRPPHLLSVAIVRLCLLPGRSVAVVVVLVIGVGTGAAVHSVNKPPPPNPLLTRPPSKTKHSGSGLR